MDAITLTVTPASQANSLESGGIRVDGMDVGDANVPAGYFSATFGWFRWGIANRHGDTEIALFGNATPVEALAYFDANNYVLVDWAAADTMRLTVVVGGVNTTANWATGGAYFVPDVKSVAEARWTSGNCVLIVDGATVITVTPGAGINFGASTPNVVYYGGDENALQQVDAVFSAP